MRRTLAHRGTNGLDVPWTAARCTLGVGLPRPDRRLGGIAASRRTGTVVAVAGRLPQTVTVDDVLTAVDSCGTPAVETLAGEWIVAVATPDRLTVLRDPAGARAVYWARHRDRILVTVEPKGIHTIPDFQREIDPVALAQFLTFSFVPGARTMLIGLHELPAGHRLDVELDDGATTVTQFFDHHALRVVAEQRAERDWIAATRSAVETAVAERLPDDEPVVAFLSGGLDSSIVTAVAAAQRRAAGLSPPTTLSLHFGAEHPNELEYARQVATLTRTDHHEVEVRADDLPGQLARMVWHLDEPIGDPVTIGNFALASTSASHARWVLNGEGGDPVFAGPKNLPMLLDHWYAIDGDPARRAATYVTTWRRAGEDVDRLLHADLRGQIEPARDITAPVQPLLAATPRHSFLNTLMVTNMRLKGANLILPKVDRMLGAHGVTPLSPLFDPALIRLSLTMPPTLKLRAGVEKHVLKQAFAGELPAAVLARPKSGMRVPVHNWFQSELKPTADSVLSPRAVKRAGIFDPGRVRDLRRYRTGHDGIRLWMLLTFELWRRQVVDRESLDGM